MDNNYGHTVVWSSGCFDNIINKQCYIVSDPDIAPNVKLPINFCSKLYKILLEYPYITKVGFALNISDLPDTHTNEIVKKWEKQFWTTRINSYANLYLANIDTTFALYRPGKLRLYTKQFYTAIRVAGDMTAIHLPWVEIKQTKQTEVYKNTANASASWTKDLKYYANESIKE